MEARLSPVDKAKALELLRSGRSIRSVARELGVSFGSIKRAGRSSSRPEPIRHGGDADSTFFEAASERQICTLDDAVAFASVDTMVWRVKSWECTSWEVGMKLRQFNNAGQVVGEKPTVKPLWRVSIRLERIGPKAVVDSIDGLITRLESIAPHFVAPPIGGATSQGPAHLCVVDLVDAHFGKLAWAAETGQDYDLKIAESLYRNAVSAILRRLEGFQVGQFLLPIGSDFLHVDSALNQTAGGTPQDVDGRLTKILETASIAVISAIEAMAAVAPVRAVYVPGNHDRVMSYTLCREIAAWFRNHPNVEVDKSPTARKYHRFHKILIGLTHGSEERHSSLPTIMATERPHDWAASLVREWHIGHLHKSRRVDHTAADTIDGVVVRTLRSLSAVDAWHYRRGYVGGTRAAEAYLYDDDSWVASFNLPVRAA
jgi:hypothetical protein